MLGGNFKRKGRMKINRCKTDLDGSRSGIEGERARFMPKPVVADIELRYFDNPLLVNV